MIISRPQLQDLVKNRLKHNPAVALLGPRQCGKTTLARMLSSGIPGDYFDLENPADLARLSAPMTVLESLSGLIVIDEVQRLPGLFPILRVLIDAPANERSFLLLGSASPALIRNVSETLAGRISFINMSGFNVSEVGVKHFRRLWRRGAFPRSYLAPDDEISYQWRSDFVKTFLARDIPQLGISIPSETLRRFWTMLAHYHGQVWNASEFARSLGSSQKTAQRYLDILSGSYMVRQIQPWHQNLKKRQVKAPKVYIRDSGLLHTLLTLTSEKDVQSHPKLGASWEGFVIEQIASLRKSAELYFWATHSGAELDLLLFEHGKRTGFEVKYSDAPKITRSMRIALEDLQLDILYIVTPGRTSYRLEEKIEVLSILDIGMI